MKDNYKISKNFQTMLLFSAVLLLVLGGYLLIKDEPLMIDEIWHNEQIQMLLRNDFSVHYMISMIPGYHFIMYLLANFFYYSSIASIRFFSAIFSVLSVLVFYAIAEILDKNNSKITTLQYFFFPVLFQFFFLIYTDVFSLFLVLLSLFFALQKKHLLSGFAGIFSVLVRQNNVVWLFFIFLLIYYKNYQFNFNFHNIRQHLLESWPFILAFVAFIIFFIINKGLAIDDFGAHPSFTFHSGNIHMILFLFFFLFLPLNISNFLRMIQYLLKNKIKVFAACVLLFAFYFLTFDKIHFYNYFSFFIRNKILMFFYSTAFLKIVFFLPMLYSIFSLCVTKLHNKLFYSIYPLTVLFLVPSWLVDPRYYFIPYSLFMLFRKKEAKLIQVEYLTLILYVISTAIIFWAVLNNRFWI
jgi:alpha-1,2-glucosyltransferase